MSGPIPVVAILAFVTPAFCQISEPIPGETKKFEISKDMFMEFCWIPSGDAQLGSPKEERVAVLKQLIMMKDKTVKDGEEPEWLSVEDETKRPKFKTRGFWLGKYPVTQAEWAAMMADNPSYFNGIKDNKAKGLNTNRFPVEYVSWDDCQRFLEKINKRNGIAKVFGKGGKFELPHEDQWEYACRGGKGIKQTYYWGSSFNGTEANCNGNYPFGTTTNGPYLERTCAVDFTNDGKYEKHPWSLCHMSGNVFQWCDNLYEQTASRVVRGGPWSGYAHNSRSANRAWFSPDYRRSNVGFRICLSLGK